jgi:glycosyltransferase involved in cell wall biosynthesis
MTHLLVHYHLRPGGVTNVVLQQAAALSQRGIPFATISAGPPPSDPSRHFTIADLDYATAHPSDANSLWHSLQHAVENLPTPHIWHIHNPTLGCHPSMAIIVQRLAHNQEHLILHIHDFAEEGRTDNLKRLNTGPPWFPIGPRIHCIVLTQRDHDHLIAAGMPPSQVTIIANPILPNPFPLPSPKNSHILYPTRAITRKNIGEMLLLAAIAPAGTTFATTLGPGNSRHQETYLHWKHLAHALDLPVAWEIAEQGHPHPTLVDCIRDATHLLTTSRQEGFGMAFLESIAWQRPLIGRSIPHIRENLARHDIAHPFLYEQIRVCGIDFANAPADEQTRLITHAVSHPREAEIIHHGTPMPAVNWLQHALSPAHQSLPLGLLDPFHPDRHINAVIAIAQHISAAPIGAITHLDTDMLHRAFSA